MRSLLCKLGIHDYRCISVVHYKDTSYSISDSKGILSTSYTLKCKHCIKLKSDTLYGSGALTIDQINEKT